MKLNFQETILQKTDTELQIISQDVAFYSEEERFIALNELERRGNLSEEQMVLKIRIGDSIKPYPIPDYDVSTGRVYKRNMIWFGSMFGGPLVAGYLIAENFKALNEPNRVFKTWIYTILAAILIFGGIFLIPENIIDKLPKYIIPFIYTGIAALIVEQFQSRKIGGHFAAGGRSFTWWRVIAIGLIGAVITIAAVIAIVFVVPLEYLM